MLILSHRGITYAPNSLKALNEALTRGFSLETDLRLSKDGRVIIIHDQNLKDNFGIDIHVRELAYKELVGTDKKFIGLIPEFENFLKSSIHILGFGQVVALHIKDYGNLSLIYKTCEIITRCKLEKRVFIFDVLLDDIKKIKNRYPKCTIGISVGEKSYGPTIYTVDTMRPYTQYIDIIWADEWEKGLYKEDFFDYCESIQKSVYVVSPELHKTEKHPFAHNPKVLWKNISSFVFDGICTDFPKKAGDFFKFNIKNPSCND